MQVNHSVVFPCMVCHDLLRAVRCSMRPTQMTNDKLICARCDTVPPGSEPEPPPNLFRPNQL